MSVVLLVDDDHDVRALFRKLLEGHGYAVAEAANGRDALVLLEAMPWVSLVVVDVMMPIMDGYGFVEAVRARPELDALPIIVMSGESSFDRLRETGRVRAFLRKPIDVPNLLGEIRRHASGGAG